MIPETFFVRGEFRCSRGLSYHTPDTTDHHSKPICPACPTGRGEGFQPLPPQSRTKAGSLAHGFPPDDALGESRPTYPPYLFALSPASVGLSLRGILGTASFGSPLDSLHSLAKKTQKNFRRSRGHHHPPSPASAGRSLRGIPVAPPLSTRPTTHSQF